MIKVFFHYPCIDGVAAGWAAVRALGLSEADLIGVSHNDIAEHVKVAEGKGAYLVFVDIAPCKELLVHVLETGAQVLILDHHETAIRSLADVCHKNLEIVLDAEQSGAGLVWRHFHKTTHVPVVVRMIEEMDLDLSVDLGRGSLQESRIKTLLDGMNTSDVSKWVKFLDCASRMEAETLEEYLIDSRVQAIDKPELKIFQYDFGRMFGDGRNFAVSAAFVNMELYGRQVAPELLRHSSSGVAIGLNVQNDVVKMHFRSNGCCDVSLLADHVAKTQNISGGGRAAAAVVRMSRSRFTALFPDLPV